MKFKLRDKVQVIKGSIGKGTIAKVIEIDEKYHYPYRCKFKKNQGHNHIWMWFEEDELELIEDAD